MYVLAPPPWTLAMMWIGLDVLSAYSAVAACLNTLGPGLGEVAASFAAVKPLGLWILTFIMLLGCLEVFILIVLLMPEFWRQVALLQVSDASARRPAAVR